MCFTLEHSGGKGPVRPATIVNVRQFQAQETPQFSGKETSAWLTVNLAERPCPVGQGWPEKLESWTPGKLRDESPAQAGMFVMLEHAGEKGPSVIIQQGGLRVAYS
jgi:hypothetical protein